MDITFNYDERIAGAELILCGGLTGNQPVSITLSGHKAYDCKGSAAWWEYNWYFGFCLNNKNYILQYNSCIQGDGWFLEETRGADLSVPLPVVFQNVGDRANGKYSRVDLISYHATIDMILGSRPRHCRGY